MPHMMAGVTAPPRWQWSSAIGIRRGTWRVIDQSIAEGLPIPVPGDAGDARIARSDPFRTVGRTPLVATCAQPFVRYLPCARSPGGLKSPH
jgi:hypothetical protein